MYVDTDVVLAELEVGDWRTSEFDMGRMDEPVTSTATAIEVQCVMEDDWSREELATVDESVRSSAIDFMALSEAVLAKAGSLRTRYGGVNVFDSIHLGSALVRVAPIVSTDTLYPDIDEIEDIDPRSIS